MNGKFPESPTMASLDLIQRPLLNLIAGLAQLPVERLSEPDYAEAEPDMLVRLAESGELVLQIIHEGLASIGMLYAYVAPLIAKGMPGPVMLPHWGCFRPNSGACFPAFIDCRRNVAATRETTGKTDALTCAAQFLTV